MPRSCGETTLGFPLGPLCMLEADWAGAEAQPRPWGPRVLPRRTLARVRSSSGALGARLAPHSFCCIASTRGSSFSVLPEKSSFPVSLRYHLGLEAQVKEKDKSLLSARHAVSGTELEERPPSPPPATWLRKRKKLVQQTPVGMGCS